MLSLPEGHLSVFIQGANPTETVDGPSGLHIVTSNLPYAPSTQKLLSQVESDWLRDHDVTFKL
jgi:hypothetical protein